jgi:hypothetical protein
MLLLGAHVMPNHQLHRAHKQHRFALLLVGPVNCGVVRRKEGESLD